MLDLSRDKCNKQVHFYLKNTSFIYNKLTSNDSLDVRLQTFLSIFLQRIKKIKLSVLGEKNINP